MVLEEPMHAKLLELAETFRQNAAETALPRYVDLMRRAAEELERFAVGIEAARDGSSSPAT